MEINKNKISKIIVLLEVQDRLNEEIELIKRELRDNGEKSLSSDYGVISISTKTDYTYDEFTNEKIEKINKGIEDLKASIKELKKSAIIIAEEKRLNAVTSKPNTKAEKQAKKYLADILNYYTNDSIKASNKPNA